MNYTITTNLEQSIYSFLVNEAFATKKTKRAIIEDALKIYQKQELERQIREGLKDRYDEYKNINKEFTEAQFNSLSK